MVSAGEGFRHDLSILWLCLSTCVLLLSLYYIYHRQYYISISSKSPVMLYAGVLCPFIMIGIPLEEILGEEKTPCFIIYYAYVLSAPAYVPVTVLRAFKLCRLFAFHDLKQSIGYGSVTLSQEDTHTLQRHKRWHSDRYLAAIYVIQFLCYFLVFVAIQQSDNHYGKHPAGRGQICRAG